MKSVSTEQYIRLFRTGEHPCSYVDDRLAQTLFLDPDQPITPRLYEELTHAGFRRSGKHLYRPDCVGCQACIATRITLSDFQLKRRHRRTLAKNQDLRLEIVPADYREQDYALYERYIAARHNDGDMYPASEDSYRDFLTHPGEFSLHFRYFLQDELVAVAVTDQLSSGLSAIYTFFEPSEEHRSLGVYSILQQIEHARRLGLPYVYLGYWVENCRKMAYKAEYQPLEYLKSGQWTDSPT